MDGEEVKPAEAPPAEEVAAAVVEDPPAAAEGEAPAVVEGEEPAADAMEAPAEAEASPAAGDMEDAGMEGAGMEGEPAEEEIDYSDDERMKLMIQHIADSLETFNQDEHWKSEHYQKLNAFLAESEQRVLFFWNDFDDATVLRVSDDQAPKFYDQGIRTEDFQVVFFIKKVWNVPISLSNLQECVQFRLIGTDPLADLLEKMQTEYVKKLLGENDWPDGVKKDFIMNLHKFMAFLNETTYAARGQTFLYIPDEDLTDIDAAAKDKDLLQRLESTMIHWTQQIKELVSNQDSPTNQAIESPLDEIAYWNKRTANLVVLTKRLQSNELKKIIKVLEHASSSYLPGFIELEKKIQAGYDEAQDNLQYLSMLSEPCRKIEQSSPKDIPKILPEALNYVRVIWELSKFYNTSERMKGLLTKISNQIIKRCRAKINKDDMLDGDVEKCISDLNESIDCCKQWKSICTHNQFMLKKYSPKVGWELDQDETIFAENEAFIQRCKDLIEICEGQLQFALKGENRLIPVFGGVQGPQYTENLMELKRNFVKNLQNIKNLSYDILDVKITKWHDDYGQYFKDQCKSLEIMYQNIIVLAFKNVSNIPDAVEMLENFDSLAKRPLVIDYVHKKAADMVYKLFLTEIKEVEETFESNAKRPPPMPFSHPKWAGLAIWAYSLIVRIDKAKSALENLYFIPENQTQKDAIEKYTKLRDQLDSAINNTYFSSWKNDIAHMDSVNIDTKLEVPVLVRSDTKEEELPVAVANNPLFARSKKNGILESNFDSELHRMLIECQYWTIIQALGIVNIPHNVIKLLQKKDQLRVLRENVMLIVRDYNNIIVTIDDKERSLFKEHLEMLDRIIDPGIKRHNWGSNADNFVYACRKECMDVFMNVKKFQVNNQKINSEFEKISRTTLTSVQKKLYLLTDFIRQQEETLKEKEISFISSFEKIGVEMMNTYDLFINRTPKIQGEWLKFVERLDENLEKSLKQSVKNTLLDLGKHIIGDKARGELVPIFKIYTILDPNNSQWKIIHDPAHEDLKGSIQVFNKKIIDVTRVIPRIEKIFRERRSAKINELLKEVQESEKNGGNTAAAFAKAGMRPDVNYQNLTQEEKESQWKARWELPKPMAERSEYQTRIANNKKIKQKNKEIIDGIENIASNMEDDRKHWQASEEVRQLYNIKSARGMQRILRATSGEDSVQKYKESIESLIDVINDVKNKPPHKQEQFIIFDYSKLKNSLIDSGNEFIAKIFQHLIKESKEDLNNLLTEFDETITTLKTPPTQLMALKKNKDLYAEVKSKMDELEARRDPIKKKFAYIQDQDGEMTGTELGEEEKAKLEGLDDAWQKFQDELEQANSIILKCYQQLKTEVDNTIEDFKKECVENKTSFLNNAPKAAEKGMDNLKAFEKLQEYKNQTNDLRQHEENMKFGLEIFNYEPIAYPELTLVEREIDLLNQVWELKNDWDKQMEAWKDIKFHDLQAESMANTAEDQYDRCTALISNGKEIKDWGVFTTLKTNIDSFKKLIEMLGETLLQPSIRDRHWREIRVEVKEDFDEHSEDFTLEKVLSLNLLSHQNMIFEIGGNARSQLKIEEQLNEIKFIWMDSEQSDLYITKEKSKADNEDYFMIKGTDNIMEHIENHSGMLGTHKSSPFYKEFDTEIDHWESTISQITETLEILMQVQSKWKYLESIFKGQPDISKQLPNEDSIFKRNNQIFKAEMERINKVKNCEQCLIVKGFLNLLYDLNKKFEQIQKNLNQFLEAKRGQFPRFYFLSNDDLLEIIGQSKDPYPILPHIKKMFEGVATLQIQETGRGNTKIYEITHLVGNDKETVEIKFFQVDPKVETWLKKLVNEMRDSLKRQFFKYYQDHQGSSKSRQEKDKMLNTIKLYQGQILITMAQMQWTTDVKYALEMLDSPSGSPAALKKCRQAFKKKVENYIELVEKPGLDKISRSKIVALIIIDEHNRDIIEQLYIKKVQSPRHFDWLQQLRFRKDTREDQGEKLYIIADQTSCSFDYGCEYQGNNGRLVVTPLTDRAYMTLTNALNMQRGGAPQGPAGTGKTETVKDLGKGLAQWVVVLNCTDQMDTVSLGKLFAGLALSGAWGCFDEFNRILLEVLSVVAQQVNILLEAIRKKEASTTFENLVIAVHKDLGLFITMNPGYAGRSELPDNLACLFRPIAMMAPNFQMICKISLMSEGFKQNEVLSKKVNTIYELMKKQLSKQTHYDFGMRAIKSVLNASGRLKRDMGDTDEITVMIKAIRDMNLPKFVAEDVILFDNLFIDLFPDCEEPENDNDALQIEIEEALMRNNLQLNENLVVKIMQLYESNVTRHGNMLVGSTMAGKTTAWKILIEALNKLSEAEKKENKNIKPEDMKIMPVKYDLINPKAISIDELYGYFDDQLPPQWVDGILSQTLKKICLEKTEMRWMILDGPVDTLWIESMNSVLDDSKLLTQTNGDRVALTPLVKLLFEVQDLGAASPATVSRAGMIFLDLEELGWEPIMAMWIKGKKGEEFRQLLQNLVDKYVPKVLKVKQTCKELVQSSESAGIICLTRLYDALCSNLKKNEEQSLEDFHLYIEKWFVFCLIWSIGATVEDGSRKDIDYILRDIESMFPHSNTVFEHYINTEKKDWASWEDKLQANWKPTGKEFHEINVPTVDTIRNRFIVQTLLDHGSQVLLVGHSGVGKTVLVDGILMTLDTNTSSFSINFAAGTQSTTVQNIIESNFERRAKNKYKPKNAKTKSICFIDDLNMPRLDTFGSQPPLELIRQWMDYQFWFDRQKIEPNYIQDFQIISSMGKPGGGRAEISHRIVSKFHLINYTIPSESNMKKIFETIGAFKFQAFDEEIKGMSETLAVSTINLFNLIQEHFLPTPAKSHYVYNMRDISKVFQGLFQADKNFYEGKEHIIKLWAHEVLRVFCDRLNTLDDRELFKSFINQEMETVFQMNYAEHATTNGEDSIFVDFMNENMKIYEAVTDFPALREHLNEQLSAYNQTPKVSKMDLVLFKDAITHVAKIYRVLNLKRGHAFLVGVGGSGRHSLTRLSSFLSTMKVYQLEVTKGFGLKQFREKLKEMYEWAGFKGKDKLKTTFIFADNDVVSESFLEDIQNMLNGGIVPNIYTNDELNVAREGVKRLFKKWAATQEGVTETPEALLDFFYNNVKDNLHLSICMSPIGEAFRNYCRMYPALINNTAIDWFLGWPEEALTEVALKFIGQMGLEEEIHAGLAVTCSYAHSTTNDAATVMQRQLKRIFYVTPTNYIELLKGYGQIIKDKRLVVDTQRNKLRNGLDKLDQARRTVEKMAAEAEIKRIDVSKATKAAEDLVINIAKERKIADEKQIFIEAQTVKIEKEKEETIELAADADRELKKAEPALMEAQKALEGLDKKYIAEIKAFTSPPAAVETVMSAVMIVLQKAPDWASVKKELTDSQFVKKIMEFDMDNISPVVMKKIEKYTKMETFQPSIVMKTSMAASMLCMWVRSVEDYSKALKIVAPKRAKKLYAEEQLRKKLAYLEELETEFNILAAKLAELQTTYDKTMVTMQELKAELDDIQVKIDRGDKLITGLAGEKTRWEASLIILDEQYEKLIGDCILAAAFMSYCGPFPSEFRDDLVANWVSMVENQHIPFTQGFEFDDFMAGPALARSWQINGLPTDKFSTENAVFVNKGLRWALNIDPQSQAMNWVKNTEGDQLVIADFKDADHIKKIEQGIIHGRKVLFLDVGEEMNPILDNVLAKNYVQIGRQQTVKIGEKEVEVHKNFKLYITTRMSNPHYTPEVSCKVAVVNFCVKLSGLVDQCLGIVVKAEQAQLEKTKNETIQKVANNKATILHLEDTILKMLSESKGNILEDVALIDTLQQSKEKSDEIKIALEQSEILMKKIDDTRETYRACGKQAAILYFVLNDLNKIDPMYQFSLDWYKALFMRSIEESREQMFQDRIKSITKYHTLQVYKSATRSLFEKDKLLLSMQMCVALQIDNDEVNLDEWNFFLRGGQVLDRAAQTPKPPFDWITQQAWDNITELEKIIPEPFTGISNAISLNNKEWLRWFLSVTPAPPESAQLPGEWETKCDDKLKKMIVLRCFRTDRVNFAIRNYVEHFMKKEFIENRPVLLKDIFDESKNSEPIIFVLSAGVDPTAAIKKQADERGLVLEPLSMGKGQSEKAKQLLAAGAQEGNWIFLANCHLSISLLPELENIIDGIFKTEVNPEFRLILSAAPHPEFSISLLQRSLKITQEPPKGIKSNMLKVYGAKSEFTTVDQDRSFRKAVFGLAWFHTLVIERKKFRTLGWNVKYTFNDSDYSVCEDLIANYLGRTEEGKVIDETYDKKQPIPWEAIQYLIAQCNYGGRVTDDRDRRLIDVYSKEIFNDNLIAPEKWRPYGTEELKYHYPADEQNTKVDPIALFSPEFFYETIANDMEENDKPLAFGQHVNAEINSQVIESSETLMSILILTPQKTSGGEGDGASGPAALITDLQEKLPEFIDLYSLKQKLRGDDNPLNVVLLQEIQRYNVLLRLLAKNLEQLEKGIKGLVVISPDLEEVLDAMNANLVPKSWNGAYFSMKPLSNWFEDLKQRYEFFNTWALKGIPYHFWIGAFTYPTGFSTSLLQRFSRKASGAPIDKLEFDFVPVPKEAHEINEHPKDGAFISGLYIEGGKWDVEKLCLCEAEVMELACPMPILHFKPIQKRAKPPQNIYTCPAYYYPTRQGTPYMDSFMLYVDLKCGDYPAEFWVKRGTALLMSLAT